MIEVVGISHKNCPVDVREQFYFSDDEGVCFLRHLLSVLDVEGAVLVSTCNRTEIYYQTTQSVVSVDIWNECKSFKNIINDVSFYHYFADTCVMHLFQVCAGMDSLVRGEYQILGQVKDAYRRSAQHSCSTPVLSRLFHKAFEAGKKVVTIHKENRMALSSATAAVAMLSDFFTHKKDIKILIYGAGLIADKLIAALLNEGFYNIRVFNRSVARAQQLCEKYALVHVNESYLYDEMLSTEVVFATTSALYPVVLPEMLAASNKKHLCFDLGVPRNIDPAVRELKNVSLFTIDDLKQDIHVTCEDESEKVFNCLLMEFNDWLSSRNLNPIIQQIQKRFDVALEQRLLYLKPRVSQKEFALVQESGVYLKDKFLGGIIAGFKEHADHGRDIEFLEKFQKVVGIEV